MLLKNPEERKNATFRVRCPYDPVEVGCADPGSEIEKDYRLKRDEHGNCIYEEVPGERNISEYVQSFANGCSLKAILDRCNLMPVRDKIAYLNQTDQGVSADLSSMPKDGTEAQIMMAKVKELCPDFAKRLKGGESFDKLLLELLPNGSKTDSASAENKPESEVENNG